MHTLSDDERKVLRKVRRLIALFRAIEPRIPSSYMDAFLAVSLKPGEGPTEYARDLGILQPLASRLLLEIGATKSRNQGEPLGLVDFQMSPNNMSKKEFFLTGKGRHLMNQIVELMDEA
jgi:hypothetical protein